MCFQIFEKFPFEGSCEDTQRREAVLLSLGRLRVEIRSKRRVDTVNFTSFNCSKVFTRRNLQF